MKRRTILLVYSLIIAISTSISAYGQVPTIDSFTPTNGPIGTSVTINGTNFDATPANNIVFFGATEAAVTAATTTELTITVPVGATYLPFTVLTNGLIAWSSSPFAVTFTGGGGTIGPNSFADKLDHPTGTNPYSVAIGDLDGDGKADLAVANYNSNSVSVFRNTSTGAGNISYEEKVDYSTGTKPTSVAIGDLDGDGKADLAVSNFINDSVSVFRNASIGVGNISYEAKVNYFTGSGPFSVKIGDLDGDGKADLAVANRSGASISVFRNTSTGVGNISYEPKVDYVTETSPFSIAIGDLDGDGKADLAVANNDSDLVSVFRNISTGVGNISYDLKINYPTGISPNSVAIGDLDGDGKAELAVANFNSNSISVFRNTSTGVGDINYDIKVDYPTGSKAISAVIDDLNGDGMADLAVANFNSNSISVLKNISTGVGNISYAPKVDYSTGTTPRSVGLGDIDGDGKADLAVTNENSASVSVFRNLLGASTTTNITAFSFMEESGSSTIGSGTVDIEVAYGTDLTNLVATFIMSTGASVKIGANPQVSGTTPNDFSVDVTYSVTAEDASTTQDWVISVTVEAPSNATLVTAFNFLEETSTITPSAGAVDIEVALGTDLTTLIANFELSLGASASIDGTTQVSGTTINDFSSDVTYTVTAEDGLTTQDWIVKVSEEADLTNPVIRDSDLPAIFDSGVASIDASIDAVDNVGISAVEFYSRRLDKLGFTKSSVLKSGDIYTRSLSEAEISDIGLEYFFLAIDANENDVSTDTIQISIRYAAGGGPAIPNLASGGKAEDWRMFSIPFELENNSISGIFNPVFNAYDDTKWRLFHYKNDDSDFVENTKGLTIIERGKGYWFNSLDAGTIKIGAGTSPTNTSSNLATIKLSPGWNQIGNPYAFDVSWNDVLVHNNITNEVESNLRITNNGTSLENSTTLKAYGGAYLLASQDITLEIPLTSPTGGRITDINDFTDGWLLGLKLESGIFTNNVTGIGMHKEALASNDRFDQIRAPRFSSFIDASFEHPEFFMPNFSRDIVPESESFVWEFIVSTNIEDELRVINWDDLEFSDGQKLVLLDEANSNVIDMTETSSYSYSNDKIRKFKIIYGDEDFLISQFENDNIYLGANYPNPFNTTTTIPYSIYGEESSYHVKINIYSLDGSLVKTLVDKTMSSGIYSAQWDTRDHSGNNLTGMFIYSLEVETTHGVKAHRMKMIVQ